MGDGLRAQLFKLFLFALAFLAIVAAFLKWKYVDVVDVNHNAMAPTVFAGDTVLVWRGTEAELGDVMLCRHPRIAGSFVMGRVVATPGMDLQIERDQLRLRGHDTGKDYVGEFSFDDQMNGAAQPFRWGHEQLGRGEHLFMERRDRHVTARPMAHLTGYYLLSDNRTFVGEDSRSFGPVLPDQCVGRLFMRLVSGGGAPAEIGGGTLDLLD